VSNLHTVEKKHYREWDNVKCTRATWKAFTATLFSIEQLDVIEVLVNERVERDEFTDMRRISPVQFLRDRELGMHGTNERIFRQRVTMKNEPVCDWPYHTRRRVYKQMLDECKMEKGEECRIQPYKLDIYYWMDKIFNEIQYWSDHAKERMYVCMYVCIIEC